MNNIVDEWIELKMNLLIEMLSFLLNIDSNYKLINETYFQFYINGKHLFTIDRRELLETDDEMVIERFWKIIYWLERTTVYICAQKKLIKTNLK